MQSKELSQPQTGRILIVLLDTERMRINAYEME